MLLPVLKIKGYFSPEAGWMKTARGPCYYSGSRGDQSASSSSPFSEMGVASSTVGTCAARRDLRGTVRGLVIAEERQCDAPERVHVIQQLVPRAGDHCGEIFGPSVCCCNPQNDTDGRPRPGLDTNHSSSLARTASDSGR